VATFEIELCDSPNFDQRAGLQSPDLLLLHYTNMASASKALDWLCDPKSRVSSHYLVSEDGRIFQMVDENNRAWHAGASSWAGREDINSCSIGIEIANVGPDKGYPPFPDIQMQAVETLCHDIFSRHTIAPERVLAHSDVSPDRKQDPGEKFNWQRLYDAGIGLWVKPQPLEEGEVLKHGDTNKHILNLQSALSTYGYQVKITGSFDDQTKHVVTAFQRHFRQKRVDGIADYSTLQTLFDLLQVVEDSKAAQIASIKKMKAFRT
jgi:N-acetylmuramoyl-L-alanine amidase